MIFLKDLTFINDYKKFLSQQRKNLINNQFDTFVESNKIKSNVKLKRSFDKLVNLLDNDTNLNNLSTSPFIFDLLNSLTNPKERELKKITNNFCEFVLTVGSGNTQTHRMVRQMYSQRIKEIIENMIFDDSMKRSDEFKTEWVATFKEQLNTK